MLAGVFVVISIVRLVLALLGGLEQLLRNSVRVEVVRRPDLLEALGAS
jgi:hypothetical protein